MKDTIQMRTYTNHPTRPMGGQMRGFTLMEIMIVMAIIGILTAIALPSYTSYIQRGARSEARSALLEAQQFMERYYSANSRYSTTPTGTTGPTLPQRLVNIPVNSPRYLMSFDGVTSNSYKLIATPQGSMASDQCGVLSLTNTGVRGASGAGTDPKALAACWK